MSKYKNYEEAYFDDEYEALSKKQRNSKKMPREKENKRGGRGRESKVTQVDEYGIPLIFSVNRDEEEEPVFPSIDYGVKDNEKTPKIDTKSGEIVQKTTKIEEKFEENFSRRELNLVPETESGIDLKNRVIKGNNIDLTRLKDIKKVENEYRGRITFGIEFVFLGNRGLSRIAWFNQNQNERDRIFNQEIGLWHDYNNSHNKGERV